MKEISLYLSTLTYTSKKKGSLISSLEHSLRIEKHNSNSNFDRTKSKDNLIYIDGKYIEQKDISLKDREKILNDLLYSRDNELDITKPTKTQLNNRAKFLKNIKKYVPESEIKFYELLEQLKNNSNDNLLKANIIKHFNSLNIPNKPAIKNLEKYIKVLGEIGGANSKIEAGKMNLKNSVEFVEYICKIPDRNGVDDISSKELSQYSVDFFKRNFPQYDVSIVGFSHNDELHQEKLDKNKGLDYERKIVGHHSHTFIKTKNRLTNENDYYKSLYDFVYKYMENNLELSQDSIKGYIGTRTTRLFQTSEQQKYMGDLFQEAMYKDINLNLLNDRGYKAVIGLYERSKEEKRTLQEDASKPISERAFNGRTLAEEETKYLLELKNEISESLDNKVLEEFEELEVHVSEQIKKEKELSNKIEAKEKILKQEVLKKGSKKHSLQKLEKIISKHKTTFGNIDKTAINPIKNHFNKELDKTIDKEINELKRVNNKLNIKLSETKVDYIKLDELEEENRQLKKENELYKSFLNNFTEVKNRFIQYKNSLTAKNVKDKAIKAIESISKIFSEKKIIQPTASTQINKKEDITSISSSSLENKESKKSYTDRGRSPSPSR